MRESILVVVIFTVFRGINQFVCFINVKMAVEVIDFMAEASCEKIRSFVSLHNAVSVERANTNVRGAFYNALLSGNGKATFHTADNSCCFNDFGIDQFEDFACFHFNNDDTAENADLGRCETRERKG